MRCPEGHESTATDYCDVCGAVMGAATPAEATAAPPSDAAPAPEPSVGSSSEADAGEDHGAKECPNCGAPGLADALFCEACGYDYTTGTMPRATNALDLDAPTPAPPSTGASGVTQNDPTDQPASSDAHTPDATAEPDSGPTVTRSSLPADRGTPAEPAAPHSPAAANPSPSLSEPWLAEVWIDPAWYRDQGSPDPMPSPGPPELIVLHKSSLLVGRESTSRGIVPDIDCGIDNGVSRRHAQLTTDGTRWWVEDLDSANGVWIGEIVGELPRKPIPARSKREFNSDDRLYVGSWTRIVVRRATQDEIDALA